MPLTNLEIDKNSDDSSLISSEDLEELKLIETIQSNFKTIDLKYQIELIGDTTSAQQELNNYVKLLQLIERKEFVEC